MTWNAVCCRQFCAPPASHTCSPARSLASSVRMRETIRAWTETVETFVLEVIFEQRRGLQATMARVSLLSLSKVFGVAVKIRRFLYNVRILRDSTLGVQVIAIGN